KKIIDEKIIYMAKDIMKKYPDNYLTKSIEPYEYNILTQSHNVTQLLNSVYKNMILKLTSKFKINKIYVDKYPGAKIIGIENIIYLEKGESKIIEIAAASIISRYYALKQIEKLNKKVNFYIPKGSTHVKVALTELKNKKLSKINFVKLHFRNTQ
ncbi:hypothetical protein HN836_00865, partial [Candidatus Woesearchaeota archaeon]|nr:hypothetical protein [Candidatus Woesearchaeota archaeon]